MFFLQELTCVDGISMIYVLGLQSPEQFSVILNYGDKSLISMDVRLKLMFVIKFLYILMVFDVCCDEFHRVWIIINEQDCDDLFVFMKALVNKL